MKDELEKQRMSNRCDGNFSSGILKKRGFQSESSCRFWFLGRSSIFRFFFSYSATLSHCLVSYVGPGVYCVIQSVRFTSMFLFIYFSQNDLESTRIR